MERRCSSWILSGGTRKRKLGLTRALVRHRTLWRSSLVARVQERKGSEYQPAQDFKLGAEATTPSGATRWLLSRLPDGAAAAARRRSNYRFLSEALDHRMPETFLTLAPGASPFLFPLKSNDKQRELAHLKRHGIAAMNFWSAAHPDVAEDDFPLAGEPRRQIIGLPCTNTCRSVILTESLMRCGG